MDWIVLIRLPDSALTKITYKGERIQCVPVSKETGKEWQAPRRKQSSGTVEFSSCWGSRISSAAVQLAFCFLFFTFNAAGESGAALVLTTRGLWKRDCKRGQCSNVTNQIIWYCQGWCTDWKKRSLLDLLRLYWGKHKFYQRSGIFFERQTEFIIKCRNTLKQLYKYETKPT